MKNLLFLVLLIMTGPLVWAGTGTPEDLTKLISFTDNLDLVGHRIDVGGGGVSGPDHKCVVQITSSIEDRVMQANFKDGRDGTTLRAVTFNDQNIGNFVIDVGGGLAMVRMNGLWSFYFLKSAPEFENKFFMHSGLGTNIYGCIGKIRTL